ncbi:MAG: ferritin [Candidatus Omnitrophota bacterium]
MISKKMTKSINDQINKELYSAYLYLGMATFAAGKGFPGAANWFSVQVKEEMTHAEKFFNYVNQQGERVLLDAIEKPPQDFKSLLNCFEETLKHEKKVTGLINDLVDIAKKEKDHATEAALQWFVSEQVEEESSAQEIIQKFKLIGNDGSGLPTIDSQLATRVFTPSVAGA